MNKTPSLQNAVLIMHTNGIYGVTYALADFLKKHSQNLFVLKLPIDDVQSLFNTTTLEYYQGKKLIAQHTFSKKGNSAKDHITHLKECVSTLKFAQQKYDIDAFDIIWGTDPLCALGGLLNRFLRRTKKVIFYVVDYSENRFSNKLINWIYTKILRFTVRRSDVNWNVNSSIKHQVENITGKKKKNLVTLPSTDLSKINLNGIKQHQRSIVCLSNIAPSLDIELLFKSYHIAKEKFPDLQLTIIGDGSDRKLLEEQLKKADDENIHYLGALDYEEVVKELPKHWIGLAPYKVDVEGGKNWNFANNLTTKYVDYIACGLPVVSTNAIPGAQRLPEFKIGFSTEPDPEAFTKDIVQLLENQHLHEKMKATGLKKAQEYSCDHIYMEALKAS